MQIPDPKKAAISNVPEAIQIAPAIKRKTGYERVMGAATLSISLGKSW
jgi:hypothetical protein